MRFWTIRSMRKKLQDEMWLHKRLYSLAEKEAELSNFKKFKCSEFFEGAKMAELNLKIYHKKMNKVYRQMEFVESLLERE